MNFYPTSKKLLIISFILCLQIKLHNIGIPSKDELIPNKLLTDPVAS